MRTSVLSGLSGLVFIALFSCGEEEEETRDIEIPGSFNSAEASMALRLSGLDTTSEATHGILSQMFQDQLDLGAVVMRGGKPTGTLEANGGGTAPEQVKALIEAGGPLGADVAVDRCGNPQLAAFITPDVFQDVYSDNSADQIMGTSMWPGSCAGDINCDTTTSAVFDVTLTPERNDHVLDVIIQAYPSVHRGTPALGGHLLAYFLTGNNPGFDKAPLFMNAKKVTISASALLENAYPGQAKMGQAGTLKMLPQKVYKFPGQSRMMSADDVSVSAEGWDLCDEHWAANYGGEEPFGCELVKAVMIDRTAVAGEQLWSGVFKDGSDPIKIDQIWDAFAYQLRTNMVCPDVSNPGYLRSSFVEIFMCPDGGIDLCVAYQDMEEFACYMGNPTLGEDFAEPVMAGETKLLAVPFASGKVPHAVDQPVDLNDIPQQQGFIKLSLGADSVIYTEQLARIKGVFDASGAAVTLPDPSDNSHCTSGPARLDLELEGTYTVEIDFTVPAPFEFMVSKPANFVN